MPMPTIPTVIAAVDLDVKAGGIVRRAARLAARCGGRLLLAHFVDHRPGLESDQVPLVSPGEVRRQMTRYARAWLLGLACHLDLGEVEIVVGDDLPVDGLTGLAEDRRAAYLVLGRPRWGFLSALSGIEQAVTSRAEGCDLVFVSRTSETADAAPQRANGWRVPTMGLAPKPAQ